MKVQKGTFEDWHIRMAHLYGEALLKLPFVTRGFKLTTLKPTDPVCEICRLSNAKRIVSRVPRKRATQPFWRVCWDLIQMNESMNGEVYVFHFLCDFTRMHFVYIYQTKHKIPYSILFSHLLPMLKGDGALKLLYGKAMEKNLWALNGFSGSTVMDMKLKHPVRILKSKMAMQRDLVVSCKS